jgi:hypothetical protein
MSKRIPNIILAIALLGAIVLIALFLSVGFLGFGPGLADYEYRIASSCVLNRYSAHEVNIDCDGINKRIDSEVFNVGWNDIYLIALSHPLTKPAVNNPNCQNCEPDSSITYWWIRDLTNKKAYGPMSEVEFEQKKKELRIPDISLMLVDEARAKGIEITK